MPTEHTIMQYRNYFNANGVPEYTMRGIQTESSNRVVISERYGKHRISPHKFLRYGSDLKTEYDIRMNFIDGHRLRGVFFLQDKRNCIAKLQNRRNAIMKNSALAPASALLPAVMGVNR
ncbi:MAG: hypothetical protein Q4C53_06290 [Clostridia bacterium]|nr:hypothetical protein [Clostridia bacterium]